MTEAPCEYYYYQPRSPEEEMETKSCGETAPGTPAVSDGVRLEPRSSSPGARLLNSSVMLLSEKSSAK